MKNILLSVNGVGVISKNNFLFTSFERTVYPWELNPLFEKVEVILGHLKVVYGRFWIIFSIFSFLGHFSFYFAFYHNLAKF